MRSIIRPMKKTTCWGRKTLRAFIRSQQGLPLSLIHWSTYSRLLHSIFISFFNISFLPYSEIHFPLRLRALNVNCWHSLCGSDTLSIFSSNKTSWNELDVWETLTSNTMTKASLMARRWKYSGSNSPFLSLKPRNLHRATTTKDHQQ